VRLAEGETGRGRDWQRVRLAKGETGEG